MHVAIVTRPPPYPHDLMSIAQFICVHLLILSHIPLAKRRRTDANFPGASVILDQLKNGCQRRRVGIRLEKGPPARHGVQILAGNGAVIGEVTSGCPSPSLGGNVAMGYIANDFKAVGTDVQLKIRDKQYAAKVAKMPFTVAHYHHQPKKT